MKIQIKDDGMGFDVWLSSADRRDFSHLLHLFKSCIPDNCRRFSAGLWRVEKRASRALDTFTAMASDAGATVRRWSELRAVISMEAMAGCLTVSDEDNSGQVLTYRAKRRAGNSPAVIVTRHDRFASLRCTVYGAAMTDAAKLLVFDYLMAGSLPNGSVRVSNREIVCSRLSFALANEMAGWLLVQLSGAANIITGNLDGKEFARLEGEKKQDGMIVIRRGVTRRAA